MKRRSGRQPVVAEDSLQSRRCAKQLKALGDPLRLRIISALRAGPTTVSKLSESLDAGLVNVSHHLGILRNASLVKTKRRGRFIEYALPDGVFQPTSSSQGTEHIDLGCCRLEVPKSKE